MITAHKSEDGREQSLQDHAQETAVLAREFAQAFGCGEMGYAAGFLHDLGKASEGFQKRIKENGPKVEHSAAGARLCFDTKQTFAMMLAYCMAGHHTGLPDYGDDYCDTVDDATLVAKMKRQARDTCPYLPFLDVADVRSLMPKERLSITPLGKGGFSASFFIRMLFSCLVDADYLNTEWFMKDGKVERGTGEPVSCLAEKLDKHVKGFAASISDLNRKRTEILHRCLAAAQYPRGLYTLTVPTGGGKTISSLAFALHHAKEHGLRRVIYAIPYTSIIEQTAQVFEGILGKENVLEHHSSVRYDDRQEEMDPARLACENWDAPVVVTTNVQFFESLFASKPSRCRKLHNIANSVLIFDEAQMLPVPYLKPCLQAIAELVTNYGCTAVLMSATQPALETYFPVGIKAHEICENREELYAFFRRAQLIQAGKLTEDELTARLAAQSQVLCIVNTRKQAQSLFDKLPEEGRYHLSTRMIPAHRRVVLDEIRRRLKDDLPCRVVSTSLVEAGVDVDFPTVYREEAGMDSQIQAAGRCNRENRRTLAESLVYIFEAAEADTHRPSSMQLPIEEARIIWDRYGNDPTSPNAIHEYFRRLYHDKGEQALDQKDVVSSFEEGRGRFSFAKIAGLFKLIEDNTVSIFIPWNEDAQAIAQMLREGRRSRAVMRAAGQFQVNVYREDFQKLYGAGMLERLHLYKEGQRGLDEELAILSSLGRYSEETGLSIPGTGIGMML